MARDTLLQSQDERGAVVNPRRATLITFIDPLEIGRRVPYPFEIDLVDVLTTESTAVATLKGQTIEEGSTHNDFYGLGTSRNEILDLAERMVQKYAGTGISVEVRTTLYTKPAFFDTHKEPVFGGSVQVFYVPSYWFRPAAEPPYEGILNTPEVFTIWKDGAATQAAEELDIRLEHAQANDVAGDRRKPRAK